MEKAKIDVAVLLVFFNRPETFEKVFEQVRLARPSKLFLYQDGARPGNVKDAENVLKCRQIAENIDWECEVYKKYQTENFGCDPSGYIAQSWAFSIVEKCIVLEDDVVPSQAFFPFCKELLDRYENDERINIICGMNSLGTYDCGDTDYFFSYTGSIWGWASWRRVIEKWTDKYPLLDDEKMKAKFAKAGKNKCIMSTQLNVIDKHKKSQKAHFESIMSYCSLTQNTINIVPKYNMISNIGNTTENGTHSASDERLLPRGIRKILSLKTYEIEFPLKHPDFVMEDVEFGQKLYRIMGWGHPWVQRYRRIEGLFLAVRYKGLKGLLEKVKRHLRSRK